MNWNVLTTEAQLTELLEKSKVNPQVIYKHSTRCGTSSMIKNRLERGPVPPEIDFHFIDLITYRALSNKIAEDLGVRHESPQVLLIRNGECVYHESHYAVYMEDIAARSMRA
ncbi:bacillithiol system redox-active protein YtxJ [Agriterribacter sp.]|uniref:bacillithiol system redox-active protein YtxJ n=1 Tax=Agriterribacter sp. TaxID=2821509 RepID=UPI002C4BD77C|nr:bacillithiol system redox-active protein YtxJ [Agriterribacter sp.]HRO46912.1 bacillithiol system redox-active protein YtxJ [Agriterribacter sp.]HRQ17406.1 bacillithiol system redox-active protein YtxJ [Agriterribacter sp.]